MPKRVRNEKKESSQSQEETPVKKKAKGRSKKPSVPNSDGDDTTQTPPRITTSPTVAASTKSKPKRRKTVKKQKEESASIKDQNENGSVDADIVKVEVDLEQEADADAKDANLDENGGDDVKIEGEANENDIIVISEKPEGETPAPPASGKSVQRKPGRRSKPAASRAKKEAQKEEATNPESEKIQDIEVLDVDANVTPQETDSKSEKKEPKEKKKSRPKKPKLSIPKPDGDDAKPADGSDSVPTKPKAKRRRAVKKDESASVKNPQVIAVDADIVKVENPEGDGQATGATEEKVVDESAGTTKADQTGVEITATTAPSTAPQPSVSAPPPPPVSTIQRRPGFFRGRRSKSLASRSGKKEVVHKEEAIDPEELRGFEHVQRYVTPEGIKFQKFWDSEDEMSDDDSSDNFRRIMCGFGTNCRLHEVIRPASEIVRRLKELQNTFGATRTLPLFAKEVKEEEDPPPGPVLENNKPLPPITWHNDPTYFRFANNFP